MLIVSDFLQSTNLFKVLSSEDYLKTVLKDSVINIQYDYRYMKKGYYVSVHAEALGNTVIPTSTNIIDAYNNAVLMVRAKKTGIPIAAHTVTDKVDEIVGRIHFPLVLFPVNPVSYDISRTVRSKEELTEAMRSLGMNFRYPISAQALSGGIQAMKSIFGSVKVTAAESLAKRCYEEFNLPICKLYVQRTEKKYLLSGIAPLRPNDLEPSDLKIAAEKIEDMRGAF